MTLHVVFIVDKTEYALPVDCVLQMEAFTGAPPVPGAPAYVAGIVTIRGRVVPVIDLRVRFGLQAAEPTADTRLIVTTWAERVVALRVDSGREVVQLDEAGHQSTPNVIDENSTGFVRAVHPLGARLLLLLDLPKILGETNHERLPALPADSEPALLPR